MNKQEALNIFYYKNKINPVLVSDGDSAEYDVRLSKLEKNVDLWLINVDFDDREVFLEVLSKFTYLTQTSCQKRFCEIVDLLKIELQKKNIKISEVLFVTVESPDGKKSGSEHICADFYIRNRCNNIFKDQIISSYSRFNFNEIINYKAIVFLDDIVGSGITLWKTIDRFLQRFPIDNSFHIYCSSLIATKRGVKLINSNSKKNNLEISWILCNSWYLKHIFKKKSEQYKVFKKYEKLIEDYVHINDPDKTYFMGFLEAALCVAFHYNTPNNTLSTFWCETDFNYPPFKRDGNQPANRLNIDDLKRKKRITDKNSYCAAVERNDIY